jgi:lysophospholipase L1-like esterase
MTVKEIEDYVWSMIELARISDIIPIPATIIPPREEAAIYEDYSVIDSIIVFNEWLKSYCDENGCEYAAFNSALSDSRGFLRADLSLDLIDPNREGYRELAKTINEIFNKTGI